MFLCSRIFGSWGRHRFLSRPAFSPRLLEALNWRRLWDARISSSSFRGEGVSALYSGRIMSSSEADVNAELGTNSKTVLNSPCPVTKFCYDCKRVVWTKIRYYPTLRTRIIALGLSPCLLCWVPFFCHWKAELDHHCCFCDRYLGTYDPLTENKTPRVKSPSEVGVEEKKQPQKKYREAGRRCLEHGETYPRRDEIMRVYKQCPGLI